MYHNNAYIVVSLFLLTGCRAVGFTVLTALFLSGCGSNEDQTFLIQGETKTCSVIKQEQCGLTLACEDDGFYQCVSN